MKIRTTSKNFSFTPDVTERVEQKLAKIGKFFPADASCTVNIMEQKNDVRVEITIFNHGAIFRSEVADRDYLCALDRAEENMLRQIRKNRTRLEKRKYLARETEIPAEPEIEEDELKIGKMKSFQITPMSVEEAVMQMNLLSHQFYAFRNAETGNVGVVYARNDGTYGVIDCVD